MSLIKGPLQRFLEGIIPANVSSDIIRIIILYYDEFKIIEETKRFLPVKICEYCLKFDPEHIHFCDWDLARKMDEADSVVDGVDADKNIEEYMISCCLCRIFTHKSHTDDYYYEHQMNLIICTDQMLTTKPYRLSQGPIPVTNVQVASICFDCLLQFDFPSEPFLSKSGIVQIMTPKDASNRVRYFCPYWLTKVVPTRSTKVQKVMRQALIHDQELHWGELQPTINKWALPHLDILYELDQNKDFICQTCHKRRFQCSLCTTTDCFGGRHHSFPYKQLRMCDEMSCWALFSSERPTEKLLIDWCNCSLMETGP